MRRILLAAFFAAAAFAFTGPAEAQQKKDPRPGYIIIRVLLDGGTAPVEPNPMTPGAPAPAARPLDPTHSVAAVVPYSFLESRLFNTDRSPHPVTNPYWPAFKHKYGMCYFYADKTFIQIFPVKDQGGRVVSYEKIIKDMFEKWSTRRSYDTIHDICNYSLMIGQVDETLKYCEEYYKMPSVADRAPQTDNYKAFAAAYKGLPEKLNAALPVNPAAEEWKSRIGPASMEQGAHYSLIYFDANQKPEAVRRLKLLENNYKAFYLWHALAGVQLPMPTRKLVAVMCDSTDKLKNYRESLDGLPIVTDACYSPSHDLLLLSPERMDAKGNAFLNLSRAKASAGWNMDELKRGRMPVIKPGQAPEAAQMMMLAVAEQYITEEADNAAISREGSRQLLANSGLLTPNVHLPGWLERGLGFYFERAKGPIYVRKSDGVKMVVGLATGFGAPNFEQHRAFDSVRDDLDWKPELTLMNILMGRELPTRPPATATDPGVGVPAAPAAPVATAADPNETPQQAAARARAKARAKADAGVWALVYYLEKVKLTGLQKFYKELANLPRDMQLEDEAVMKLFCKNFDLLKNDQNQSLDTAAFASFAANWLEYMKNVPHFDYEVPLDAATLDPFGSSGVGAVGAGPAGGPGGAGGPPGGARPGGGPPGSPQPGGGGGPPGRPPGPGG